MRIIADIGDRLSFVDVKKTLRLVFAGLCILTASDQFALTLAYRSAFKPDSSRYLNEFIPEKSPPLDPWPVYLKAVETRDLFTGPAAGPDKNSVTDGLRDAAKNFRLVGIARFERPEAILEDAAKGASIFVREGDAFGALVLMEIKQDSVVVAGGNSSCEIKISERGAEHA